MNDYDVSIFNENYVLLRLLLLIFQTSKTNNSNVLHYKMEKLKDNLYKIYLNNDDIMTIRNFCGISQVYKLGNNLLLNSCKLCKKPVFTGINNHYVEFNKTIFNRKHYRNHNGDNNDIIIRKFKYFHKRFRQVRNECK
jgi:hypothetical protein